MSGTSSTNDRLAQRLEEIAGAVSTMQKQQEDSTLRSKITAYGSQLQQQVTQADADISRAEATLTAAHEEGDPAKIASSQRHLTEAITRKTEAEREIKNHKRAVQEFEEKSRTEPEKKAASEEREPPSEQRVDTTNLDAWTEKNKDWYGVDTDLTSAAREIDQTIRKAGALTVGSKQYFDAIDRQLASRFPDRFKRNPSAGGSSMTSDNTQHGQGGGGGRIPKSVLEGWKRMGINVDDPKTLERMVSHRKRAVHKGILPENPQYGPIIS